MPYIIGRGEEEGKWVIDHDGDEDPGGDDQGAGAETRKPTWQALLSGK
jgi:hypothetical protein